MIHKFIEFYKDPKKRSLIALPAYFLFFVFVFTIFRFKTPEVREVQNSGIKTNSNQNYYATYDITFANSSDEPIKNMKIHSKRYKNMEYYQIDLTNEKYFRKDDTLYYEGKKVDNFSIQLPKLTQEYFQKYIEKSKEIYKTEYNDGKVERAYEIPLSIFSEIYDEKVNREDIVTIKVKKQKEKIENIYIDMKSYYLMEIEINYSNYNEAKEEDVMVM